MASSSFTDNAQRRALEVSGYGSRGSNYAGLSQVARYSAARLPIGSYLFTPNVPVQPINIPEDLPLSAHVSLGQADAGQRDWWIDFSKELEELPALAMELGYAAPSEQALKRVAAIARLCNSKGLSAPHLDLQENGGVELFCKEGAKGIWCIVHPDDFLQIYGDFGGDQWRAKYPPSGEIWSVHLSAYLDGLKSR